MKVGDIVYLKDVGFPFDGRGIGPGAKESWEGASCVVTNLRAGALRDMVEVRPVFPIGGMETCLFFHKTVKIETRTWLKKNVRRILSARKRLDSTIEKLQQLREDL